MCACMYTYKENRGGERKTGMVSLQWKHPCSEMLRHLWRMEWIWENVKKFYSFFWINFAFESFIFMVI